MKNETMRDREPGKGKEEKERFVRNTRRCEPDFHSCCYTILQPQSVQINHTTSKSRSKTSASRNSRILRQNCNLLPCKKLKNLLFEQWFVVEQSV